MKKLTKVFLILLLTNQVACNGDSKVSTTVDGLPVKLEGVVNGGGGKGVKCGNVVRLLDLYEAEQKNYPPVISSGNFENDLKNYVYKLTRQILSPENTHIDEAIVMLLLSKIIDISPSEKLEFTNDATLPSIPANCEFVQIAINVIPVEQNEGMLKIYRDTNLWNLMPTIDQVALIVHEYAYWRTRLLYGESSSDDTRILIGKLFSGLETYEMFTPIWGADPLIMCGFYQYENGNTSTFYAASEIRNGVSGTGIYFSVIDRKAYSSRSNAFIPKMNPEELLNPSQSFSKSTQVNNVLFDRKWSLEIKYDPKWNLSFRINKIGEPFSEKFSNWSSCEKIPPQNDQ